MNQPVPHYVPVAPSASRGTTTFDRKSGAGYRGLDLYIDITDKSGTSPTLTVKVQAQDPLSKKWVDVEGAATAAIDASSASTARLVLWPGIAASANKLVNTPVPFAWRVVGTVGGSATPKVTYSIAAVLLP